MTDGDVLLEFTCPREGTSLLVDGHYISLGRDQKGRLLAIITKGHPNVSDGITEVCDAQVVQDKKEATLWFGKTLLEKPWLPRN